MRRMLLFGGILALTSVLAAGAVRAQTQAIGGTIPDGANGDLIKQEIGSRWSTGDDFDCSANSPLTVIAHTGLCDWRQVTLEFEVTAGPTVPVTSVPHPFGYEITCNELTLKLEHKLGWDGNAADPVNFTPINEGTFVFNLANGDQITVVTTEGMMQAPESFSDTPDLVPTLGEWGGIVVGFGIALAGVWLIMRRRRDAAA